MSQSLLELDYGPSGGVSSGATFSDCRTWRYRLHRRWSDRPFLVWLMLNPSTADESNDDPTICRCSHRAHQGGFGGVAVLPLLECLPDSVTIYEREVSK